PIATCRVGRQAVAAAVGFPGRGAQLQIFLAAAQRPVVRDEEGPRVGAAVLAYDELALVGCEADAVGLVDAASDGMWPRHVPRVRGHANHLACAGVGEVNPA